MKKLLENIRKLWKQYVVFTLIFIIAILFYLALEANSKTSQAIVAFGTLILALFTALSILDNQNREKQRRKDELAKEDRDHREKLLNEIINWAIDIAKCESEHEIYKMSLLELEDAKKRRDAQFIEADRKATLLSLHQGYQSLDARSEYIKGIAKIFGKDIEDIVNNTKNILGDHLIILGKEIERKTTQEERDKHWRSLVANAIVVTKIAAQLKTKNISLIVS